MSSDLESNFLLGEGLASLVGGTLFAAQDCLIRGTSITKFTEVKVNRVALYTFPLMVFSCGCAFVNDRDPISYGILLGAISLATLFSGICLQRHNHDYEDPDELVGIKEKVLRLSFSSIKNTYGLEDVSKYELLTSSGLKEKYSR